MLVGFTLPLFLLALFAVVGIGLAVYGNLTGVTWSVRTYLIRTAIGTAGCLVGLLVLKWALSKVILDREDIYGTYRVDRDFYPGRQADWQHDHYELTINPLGTITLRERYDGGGTATFSGTYQLKEGYASAPRLQLTNDYPIHHVVSENPTLYRETWGFYYVFRSPRYGNMFFRKVRWWEE
ncbi:MAG: hypothetical protein WA952_03425 [Lewinella sp.]